MANNISGETSVEYFDKCIWAAGGLNGRMMIPKSIRTTLHLVNFKGILNKIIKIIYLYVIITRNIYSFYLAYLK